MPLGPSLAAALPAERRVLACRGWAGEKSGLFEHPEGMFSVIPHVRTIEAPARHNTFLTASYELLRRAADSDSKTASQEFWSFSTNRFSACSKETTRSVFGAPS